MTTKLTARTRPPSASPPGYLQAAHRFPMLHAEEELGLALRYREHGDCDAARQLIASHLRLVAKIARGYRGYELPQEDLIQEGNIGLMKAVKRFDPSYGVRLAAFVSRWIRAEILDFVLRNWRVVKVATTKAQRKLFFNLRGTKGSSGRLTRQQTESVASELCVRIADVIEMDKRLRSRDTAFDGESTDVSDHRAPAAMLEDRRYEPAAEAEASQWAARSTQWLAAGLERLDDRSRGIVIRRWLSEPKATLGELADEHGLSAERVRQLEARALVELRATLAPRRAGLAFEQGTPHDKAPGQARQTGTRQFARRLAIYECPGAARLDRSDEQRLGARAREMCVRTS
jgi:RNA polymerase sigma-32 factor